MSITDPRRFVKDLLKTISVFLDDESTHASIACAYEDGPDNSIQLFYDLGYDVVISVGRHSERESGDSKRILGIPLRYDGEVPVYVTAVNKSNSTAPVTLNKVRLAILQAVENAALYAKADLSVLRDDGNNQVVGGHDPLHMDRYWIRVRPLSSLPDFGGSSGGSSGIVPPTTYYGFEWISAGYNFEDGFERVWS